MSSAKKNKSLPAKVFGFFSSFGLAVVLLLLLLALTFFGTLSQVEVGLYEASNKYFESAFVIDKINGFPIVLPGVYLVSVFLFINLLCGAIIKARKSWRRPGMLIAHSGILYILFAGFVAYHFTREGRMNLSEGERGDEINNLIEWSIEVSKFNEDGTAELAYVVPPEDLVPLRKSGARRTFHSDALPFEFEVSGWVTNFINGKMQPVGLVSEKSGSSASLSGPFIDGIALSPQKVRKTREENLPAAYIKVKGKDGEELAHTIAAGTNFMVAQPVTFEVGEDTWGVNLTRRRYALPFALKLEKFTKEEHPGTERARVYSSDVVRIDENGEEAERYHISMNEPMRYNGYTAYQASFGQNQDGSSFTSLSISYNPSDQWPKYGTYVIAVGMVIHFGQKLFAYLLRMGRVRQRELEVAAAKPDAGKDEA